MIAIRLARKRALKQLTNRSAVAAVREKTLSALYLRFPS